MKLTNAMEPAVKAHMNRVRLELGEAPGICWCPLCRADMIALALTALPPRYGTRRSVAVAPGSDQDVAVADAVARAVRTVSRNPKHAPAAAVPAGEPVFVVNFPLEEGFRAADQMAPAEGAACDCWHCRCDAVAFALNRYPARYGVEHQGRTHLLDADRATMRDEIGHFLGLARTLVAALPRHETTSVA